jgi:hypothetical protein
MELVWGGKELPLLTTTAWMPSTRHSNASAPLKFIAMMLDNISINGEHIVSHRISAGIPAVDL